jgi:hypothetical protein
MRKNLLFFLIFTVVILAGCGNHSSNTPEVDTAPQAHLFQVTPTASGEKDGASEDQAKAITTVSYMPGYPTPLSTYLVPSRLIKITYAPTQGQPTTSSPTGTPTKTPTLVPTSATPTRIPTTATPTRVPTTATPTRIPPTATSTSIPPTATPTPQYAFAVQPGSPALLPNFANTSAGCSWQGIAGQVFNADGLPVLNLVVKAGGTWNGAAVNLLGMTGTSTAYGEGGFELTLGTKAVNSTNTVYVQIYDLASKPLTDKVYISTSSDCSKNLTLVNFKAVIEGLNFYVPLVIQTDVP